MGAAWLGIRFRVVGEGKRIIGFLYGGESGLCPLDGDGLNGRDRSVQNDVVRT